MLSSTSWAVRRNTLAARAAAWVGWGEKEVSGTMTAAKRLHASLGSAEEIDEVIDVLISNRSARAVFALNDGYGVA